MGQVEVTASNIMFNLNFNPSKAMAMMIPEAPTQGIPQHKREPRQPPRPPPASQGGQTTVRPEVPKKGVGKGRGASAPPESRGTQPTSFLEQMAASFADALDVPRSSTENRSPPSRDQQGRRTPVSQPGHQGQRQGPERNESEVSFTSLFKVFDWATSGCQDKKNVSQNLVVNDVPRVHPGVTMNRIELGRHVQTVHPLTRSYR